MKSTLEQKAIFRHQVDTIQQFLFNTRPTLCRPDSSVGRAEDWKSSCRGFDSLSGHHLLQGPDRKHDASFRSYSMISPTNRRLFTAFNSCRQNRQIIDLKIKYTQILRYAHIASINIERCLRTTKEKGNDSSRCWSRIARFIRENRWARDPRPEKKKNAV